jgi:hypothetical protein
LTIHSKKGKLPKWDFDKLTEVMIFDVNKYYREFVLDFSPVANPFDALTAAEFTENGHLKISYLSGEDYKEKALLIRPDGNILEKQTRHEEIRMCGRRKTNYATSQPKSAGKRIHSHKRTGHKRFKQFGLRV